MAWFRTEKRFLDAAAQGDVATLRDYLSSSQKWLHTSDKKTGDTPLLLATRNGHMHVVSLLLGNGGDIHAKNSLTQATLLHEAVEHGRVEMAAYLLENGMKSAINQKNWVKTTPLQYAITRKKTDILEMFLKSGAANLVGDDPPAVYFAVNEKNGAALKLLLTAGADPNVPRTQRLDESIRLGGYRFKSGEKIVKTSPLQLAVFVNDTEMTLDLLKAGAKPRDEEHTLHTASAHGNVEIATALLEHGAVHPRARNEQLQTPLHLAAMKNQPEMVRFLLAQGVPKDIEDKDRHTALYYAQQFVRTDIIEILQDKTAPVITPVKPVAQAQPAAQPAAPAPVQATDSESWTLVGKHSLAHVSSFPALNRKLTELFNFESRERVVITENMNLKTETMGPHENFDNLGADALSRALREFRRLGGKADDEAVFKNSLHKLQIKKP